MAIKKWRYKWGYTWRSLVIGFVSLVLTSLLAGQTRANIPATPTFLGEATLPAGLQFQNTEVGGLSGITYDAERQVYYAIADDRSQKAPARFYTLAIDLSQGILPPDGVKVTAVNTILNTDSKPFPPETVDPEGIALTRDRTLWISSEGNAQTRISPFVRQISLQGQHLRELPVPEKFLPTTRQGVRQNLAFESLTLTPNQRLLYVANENALIQDGDEATPTVGSPVRILRYRLPAGIPDSEFVYFTDPVVAPPMPADGFNTNGLVELLALDDRGAFLALERSFSAGIGHAIRLYQVSLRGATNVKDLPSLRQTGDTRLNIKPVEKTLLLDLTTLGITLYNLEGITLGPRLPDGRRSLIIAGDNNFGRDITQILAFSL